MNCIILHGCPWDNEKKLPPEKQSYDKHWFPWTKRKLEENGIPTLLPRMPNPWRPEYEDYKREFDKLHVTKNTILVGHSCGCSFLVRWLGDTQKKIHKLILVAPWKVPSGEGERYENRKRFYIFPVNEKIKENVGEIIIFTSNNEAENGKRSARIFHKALGGKVIELKDHGHYILGDMGTEEFPELIEEILK